MSEPVYVEFTCWNCGEFYRLDLNEIQQERLDHDYQDIQPNPEKPQRFHIKCPGCDRFNTVYI